MSDFGRKDVSSQVQEKITPDSQKSTVDKFTESATTASDKVAAAVQPGDSKSTSQKLSDTVRSETGSAHAGGKSYLEQAQDMAKPYIDQAKPYIAQAEETVQPYVDAATKKVSELASSISGGEKK